MQMTLGFIKLHKLNKIIQTNRIQTAFSVIARKNIEPLKLALSNTGIEENQLEYYARLAQAWSKPKIGTPLGRLSRGRFEKYLYLQSGINKVSTVLQKSMVLLKIIGFHSIQYGGLPSIQDELIEFKTPEKKAYNDPRKGPIIIPKLRIPKRCVDNSFTGGSSISDVKTASQRKSKSLGEVDVDQDQKLTQNAIVSDLHGYHSKREHNRRKTSDELFEKISKQSRLDENPLNISHKDHSFERDPLNLESKKGIDEAKFNFSISTISDSSRSKFSPMKESLVNLFSSKRRENFGKNITPKKLRADNSDITSTERDRMTEIKLRLSKLSKLLSTPSSFTQRKIEKYFRFEHSLFQIIRIAHGCERRNLLHAFEKLQFNKTVTPLQLNKPQLHLRNALQVANQRWQNIILQSFFDWRRICVIKNYAMVSAKVLNSFISLRQRENIKYAIWKMKEKELILQDRSIFRALLPEKLRGAFNIYHSVATRLRQQELHKMKSFFCNYQKIRKRLENIEEGSSVLKKTIIRVSLRHIRIKMKLGNQISSFARFLQRAALVQMKTAWGSIHRHFLSQGTLEERKQNISHLLYKLINQKRNNHLLTGFMVISDMVKQSKLVTELEMEVQRYEKCLRLIHLLASKDYWSKYGGYQKIRHYAERRFFSVSSLFDTLKLIFLKRKVLIFTYMKTQTKLKAYYQNEADHQRKNLQSEMATTEEIKTKTRSLGARNIAATLKQLMNKFKRDAGRKIFNNLTLSRIKEESSLQSEDSVFKLGFMQYQGLLLISEKIIAIASSRLKRQCMAKIKSIVRMRLHEQKLAKINKINLLEKVIGSLFERKRINLLSSGLQCLVNSQHQQAFKTHNLLLKLGTFIKKCYLAKLHHSFSVWKLDIEICRVEWQFLQKINTHELFEDRENLKEIERILKQHEASEELIKVTINKKDATTPMASRQEIRHIKKRTLPPNSISTETLRFDPNLTPSKSP